MRNALDVLDDAFGVLAHGRPPQLAVVSTSQPFELEVDVELYPNLYLDGWVNCGIELQDGQVWISKHKLTVKDRHGQSIKVDWDDLLPRAQEKIEDRITSAVLEKGS
jgi:hypothetical protein